MKTLSSTGDTRGDAERLATALFTISAAAAKLTDRDVLFRTVHETVASLMPALNFYIALIDDDGETVSFPYFVDQFDSPPEPRRLRRGLTEYIIRSGRPLLASPEVLTALEDQGEIEVIGTVGVDWLGVPLEASDRTTGAIVVQSYDHSLRYGERDLRLLSFVAQQIGSEIEQGRAAEALRASEEQLRTLLETMTQGVVYFDAEARAVSGNRAASALYGLELGSVAAALESGRLVACDERGEPLPLTDWPVLGVLRDGQPRLNRVLGIRDTLDDTIRWHEVCAVPRIVAGKTKPVGVVMTVNDITERRRMEEEWQKTQKLESLGVLAGGIAHDFNNLLTAVLGNLSLAAMDRTATPSVITRLEEAERAVLRARTLTQQLLTFSRGGAPVRHAASIAELVSETVDFALSGSNVRADVTIGADLWPVEVDTAQIGQVINNLALNAVQAMPDGGVLQICVSNEFVEPDAGLGLPDGRYVRIAIRDSGAGIAPENIAKVFDPYFTTKRRGSGLGLAIAYSVVTQHGGKIVVDSRPGMGTTVTFWLPASALAPIPALSLALAPLAGGGRVLVMDDDEPIRLVVSAMLNFLHYEPFVARDGAEMIDMVRAARSAGQPFDAVILDLTVPGGMGGKEAITRLRALDREVKAIVSSGFSDDPVMANFESYGFDAVVAKPYKVGELSQVLHRLLDA